jgi:hypothetical protein
MRDPIDFLIGLLIGVLATVFFATRMHDEDRNKCDNKLPRTEKCVQVWVPEKSIKGDTP